MREGTLSAQLEQDAKSRRSRLEKLRRLCEHRGITWTEPRRVVLDVILALGTHPTADEVHAAATLRRHGLGRATVYRALEAFARNGILRKVCHPGAAVRYDPRIEPHHHVICLRCERIVDITDRSLPGVPVPDVARHGFEVSEVQVILRGLCRECRKEEER